MPPRQQTTTDFIFLLINKTIIMRLAILGNSGSGKSTLARLLAAGSETPVLDLDTLVFEPGKIAVQRDHERVLQDIKQFCTLYSNWVIEGCYADCINAALQYDAELIFLEPGLQACLSNCRNRPWEPHKYSSKKEQDTKLEFLLQWVADYYERDGNMSLKEHQALFDEYSGPKRLVTELHTQKPD